MYLWWSLCILYLLTCLVKVTAGDSIRSLSCNMFVWHQPYPHTHCTLVLLWNHRISHYRKTTHLHLLLSDSSRTGHYPNAQPLWSATSHFKKRRGKKTTAILSRQLCTLTQRISFLKKYICARGCEKSKPTSFWWCSEWVTINRNLQLPCSNH